LDKVLRTGLGVSYYDGSACHLDLVQWATDPVWGKIPSSAAREALLEDGVPHLRAQLTRENVRLVLLNGRQVIDQVTSLGLAELIDIRNFVGMQIDGSPSNLGRTGVSGSRHAGPPRCSATRCASRRVV
jgi:hypothetical protein